MKKKILLLIALISFSFITFSQGLFYASFGYNLGYAKLQGLNSLVRSYNEKRPWLDDTMDKFNFPNGFCASIGFGAKPIMFEFSWVGRHMTRSASGIQPGNGLHSERQLKWRMNSFNLGALLLAYSENSALGIGGSIDIGNERIFSRKFEEGVPDTPGFYNVQKDFFIGSTLFIHVILGMGSAAGLHIRPYFQFPYLKNDYQATAEYLSLANPNSIESEFVSNSWNLGVQLMFGVFVHE